MGKWKKGQSGNPATQFQKGGRKMKRIRNPFPQLIARKTNNGKHLVIGVYAIFKKTKSASIKLRAAEWLRDTGWGTSILNNPIDAEGAGLQALLPVIYVPYKSE